ncbi:hypothetical protein PIB30_094691, partial [Stylosanthes scabra]|nr:hypothetical protein [Stylosanthes scabra]
MAKVGSYILGEFGQLIARQPGCGPKELFNLIHEKLPTVSTSTVSILLSAYAKMSMHSHPPDPELQNQIWSIFKKKGEALMDILAEMPKFPERQLHQRAANGTPPLPAGQLGLVKMPSMSDDYPADPRLSQEVGALATVNYQPPPADILSDLLGPLAIEGPPISRVHPQPSTTSELEGTAVEATAIVPARVQANSVQIGIKAEWRDHHGHMVLFLGNKNTAPLVSVQAIMLPPTHFKMELSLVPETIPPHAQVQCRLEVINLRSSRDVAVLDLSYKFGNDM